MDAQSMPDVMKNRCYSSMRSSKIYTWTLDHNLCQDSISYFQCMNITLLRKLVKLHISYYLFRHYPIMCSAVLILEAIPKIVGAARVCDPPRYHIHQIMFKESSLKGSHIQARPIFTLLLRIRSWAWFRTFRLAGVSVFRAFVSMSGFWGT